MSRVATQHGGVIVLLTMLSGIEGLGYLLTQSETHLPMWSLIIPPALFAITLAFPRQPDRIDAKCRLEKAFGEKLDWPELTKSERAAVVADITVGELHDRICHQLLDHGKSVPCSSWHRVQHALAYATGCPPCHICRCDSLGKVFHTHI